MPLFLITSGFFFKNKPLKEEIKNLIKRLLIPTTILLSIICLINNLKIMNLISSIKNVLKTIIICWSHSSKITYGFSDTGVLWFIYLLIGIRILFLINKKITKNNELYLFLLVLLETYLGYLVGCDGYWLPWSFDVIFSSIIFYYFGYILKKYNLLKIIMKNYQILLILLIIWIIGFNNNYIELAIRKYTNGFWSYFSALSGSLIIIKISMIMNNRLKIMANFFKWCGKNSLYILFGHYFEIELLKYNFKINNIYIYKFLLIQLKCAFSIYFCIAIINKIILFKNERNINY